MRLSKSVRRLRRYLQPDIIAGKIVFCVGIIIFTMYILSKFGFKIMPNTDGYGIVVVFIFFISFLISGMDIMKRIRLQKQLHELEQSKEMPKVLKDFEYARSMYDGKLMMGNFYAFGKGCGAIIKYTDIDNVFEYVHYTNSIRDQRILKVKMKNCKEYDLCYLKVFKKRFEEERQIVEIILKHNPSVKAETVQIDEDS